MTDMSFISLFLQADMVVKTVMLILFIASVWSWAIIFDKIFLFKSIRNKSKVFEKNFWSGQSLENLFERIKGRENHPLAVVFTAAMQEWQSRNVKDLSTRHELRAGTKERVNAAMLVASSKSLDKMERSLSFLATVGSSAPFIGLFGTVWGIMISFQSIAISKNTTLAVVAPGIAEALLATALGLAAAIPAMIFYNKFANELNRTANGIDDFTNELSAIISRELDGIK
ncbi:MAG: protein TolQ [Rickettsiales bacterium]